MYSLLLKNALVIDGTGKAGEIMDLAVEGDEIANVAPGISTAAREVVDLTGRVVCPGFIDIQNHSDSYWQLFENSSLDSLLHQGFTTILVGQCGASLAPYISPKSLEPLAKWHDVGGINISWRAYGEFLGIMQGRTFGCNVGSLVGLDTVRQESHKQSDIEYALEQAMDDGAFGFSLRAGYGKTFDSAAGHLVEKFASRAALISFHIDNEREFSVEMADYTAELALRTGANIKISHLKLPGNNASHRLEMLLETLETARHRGANLHFDIYPYTSTWQSLYRYLPQWVQTLSLAEMQEAFRSPAPRASIIAELNNHSSDLRNLIVSATTHDFNLVGKKISDIAQNLDCSSEEAIVEILKNSGDEVLVFDQNLNPAGVHDLMFHPLAMLATDGAGFSADPGSGKFGRMNRRLLHPRCFGATGEFFEILREQKTVSIEEAVRKLTSLPAKKMNLKRRGVIAVGNKADLVSFDPKRVRSKASLSNPTIYTQGMDFVWVNGKMAVFHEQIINSTAGIFLKR